VAAAQTLTVAETETLVRASYFEGMPEEPASRIGPAGAARLVEMLFDPEEVMGQRRPAAGRSIGTPSKRGRRFPTLSATSLVSIGAPLCIWKP
jgi:hypothetical protein